MDRAKCRILEENMFQYAGNLTCVHNNKYHNYTKMVQNQEPKCVTMAQLEPRSQSKQKKRKLLFNNGLHSNCQKDILGKSSGLNPFQFQVNIT